MPRLTNRVAALERSAPADRRPGCPPAVEVIASREGEPVKRPACDSCGRPQEYGAHVVEVIVRTRADADRLRREGV